MVASGWFEASLWYRGELCVVEKLVFVFSIFLAYLLVLLYFFGAGYLKSNCRVVGSYGIRQWWSIRPWGSRTCHNNQVFDMGESGDVRVATISGGSGTDMAVVQRNTNSLSHNSNIPRIGSLGSDSIRTRTWACICRITGDLGESNAWWLRWLIVMLYSQPDFIPAAKT